jgi:hypothetical protein
MKIEKGDLVQLKGIWKNRVGLVDGIETDWFVIKNHISAAGCIADLKDVILVKKQVVPKQYLKCLK